MKSRIMCLLTLALCGSLRAADFSVYEANYPTVKDYNVSVDSAALSIAPHGAYVEMNLELVVSYAFESWFFKNYNELEFLWDFTLPDQASVTGFWIWLGDTCLEAAMLDKWTAELLFSEVSSPVRNPALLTQSFPNREGQIQYQLKLYPVIRNTPRRFKIQYLVPARPTNETLRLWLPTTQLTSMKSPGIDTLHVRFKGIDKPSLLGGVPIAPAYRAADTTWTFDMLLDYDQFVEIIYPTPISGSFFFSSYREGEESFYQLAVYPPEAPPVHEPRNFVILVDFNRFNTSGLDGELLLMLLKETMQQALSERDSAAIAVAFDGVEWGSDRLLPCTEAMLDSLFEPVLKRAFPSYSYFQPLIAGAADFIQTLKGRAEVVVFTNTDEINEWMISRDAFADEIIGLFPAGTPIHVIDLNNTSGMVYQNGRYETQLASFYGRLCDETAGNLFFLRYHAVKSILAALFYERINHFQEVEVQTRFASGYAFGKHLIALHEGYYPLRFPVMEIGRFRGELPLDLTVLGKIRLDKIEENLTIHGEDAVPGTRQLAAAWYGDHIRELLARSQSNATIQEITDLSLRYKILTPYSGLLVFRPNDNKGYNPTATASSQNSPQPTDQGDKGGNENDYTAVQTAPKDLELSVSAYPNPFNARVNIRITLPEGIRQHEFRLSVYDLTGRKIAEFPIESSGNGVVNVAWDGKTSSGETLPSGIYLAVFWGPGVKKTVKLNLIK